MALGIYDADNGTYPSQGAPAAIVGPFVSIDGHLRSPFYSTASPNEPTANGRPFHELTPLSVSWADWRTLCHTVPLAYLVLMDISSHSS